MGWQDWLIGFSGGAVVLALAWLPFKRWRLTREKKRAKETFLPQREHLEAQFLQAAGATGKPRGLRWQSCEWDQEVIFALDRKTRQMTALAGVTIHFEAIEGGDMEGVAAVTLPRNASAVFFYNQGHWHTAGRAVFNLNPAEALHHFREHYEPVS